IIDHNGHGLLLLATCWSAEGSLSSKRAVGIARHLILIHNDSLAAYVGCVCAGLSLCSHGSAENQKDDNRNPGLMLGSYSHLRAFILHHRSFIVSTQWQKCLFRCRSTSDESLKLYLQAVARSPLLEELHLSEFCTKKSGSTDPFRRNFTR